MFPADQSSLAAISPVRFVICQTNPVGEAIPWVRVYILPAEVYWDHRAHLKAGQQCEACHGPVAQMDATVKTTNVTTMAGCLECHRNNNAGTGCGFCHEEK